MLSKIKNLLWVAPLFFIVSFADAGGLVMQGNYQSSVISPRCSWLNNVPFKSLMCDGVKVIEYSTYDNPGLVTYFNSNAYTLNNTGSLPTISSKSSFDTLSIAGDTVMQGNYQTNTINTSKCSWTNNTPFKTLYCGGAKVVQYVTQPYAGLYPGQINYIDDVNFVSVTQNNVKTIFYKSPFSDSYKDQSLVGKFEFFTNDKVLDKPIIMVEAYDPTNSTSPYMLYNDMWVDNEENKLPKKIQLLGTGLKQLVYGDRDLIIVNFPDGSAKLDTNAILLQRIIQEVNARKVGAHPTAVIGHSMGGIIAKRALKNMELAGIDHQTSLYVSYDVPHIGANSPLSLQESVAAIADKLSDDAFGLSVKDLRVAGYYSNSDAAKEMLISGPDYDPTKVTNASFPSKLARVAITSGSMMGVQQNPADQQTPTEKMDASVPNPGAAFVEGEEVAFFYFHYLKNQHWGLDIHWIAKPIVEQKSGKSFYWDNVPGSFEFQYDLALKILYANALDIYTPLRRKHPIAFAATTSSLAIQGSPLTPARDTFKYYSPFDKFIAIDADADPYVPKNDRINSMVLGCDNYKSQALTGANGHHTVFYPSQLSQLACALNEFHKIGASIPDRSFKSL